MNTGVAGLMYLPSKCGYLIIRRQCIRVRTAADALLPVVFGASIACAMSICWDIYFYKAKARGVAWSNIEEYRRLPLACIGGPLYVISLFWLGWTGNGQIHWVVPMLSGITFGCGFMLIFIAMLNYLTDAYETFSASAQSASSCTRALSGAALPVAASPMFNALGVNWVCSMLALVSLPMSLVPFAFIKYGQRIRTNSKFCQELKRLKEERQSEEDAEGQVPALSRVSFPARSSPDEEKGEVSATSGNVVP